MDPQALRESWQQVAAYGDAVPSHFYSTLFLRHPATRAMFPTSMAAQRDRLVAALGKVVANVDDLDSAVPFLQQLGREHRKFGVEATHYPLVGGALLSALEYFLGDRWTPELAEQWAKAYSVVSQVMIDAAAEVEGKQPRWWVAEITARHHVPHTEIVRLMLKPTDPPQPLPYVAGQSVALEHPMRPRVWRWFSPANAPRADGLIELHVTAAPGGQVSPVLVHRTYPGDNVRLGAAIGHRLTLAGASPGQPLLLIAGGTGLSPLRAIVEQVVADTAAGQHPRRVVIIHGARRAVELYDNDTLRQLAAQHPWLTLLTAVSDDGDPHHSHPATAVDAALAAGPWADHLIYVCGSPPMVAATTEKLTAAGHPTEQLRTEEFR